MVYVVVYGDDVHVYRAEDAPMAHAHIEAHQKAKREYIARLLGQTGTR